MGHVGRTSSRTEGRMLVTWKEYKAKFLNEYGFTTFLTLGAMDTVQARSLAIDVANQQFSKWAFIEVEYTGNTIRTYG
jgi:hypothetical protein